MIQIILSNKIFENDVYPLVKAFCPRVKIKVYSQEELLKLLEEDHYEADLIKADFVETVKRINIDFSEQEFTININCNTGEDIFRTFATIGFTEDKAKYKNSIKRELYYILNRITGRELPWGILTGIRPTKLVYEMLSKGMDEVSIDRRMKEEYLCSEEKIRMSIRIAKREMELLQDMDYRNGYSLYIGIPFCPSTCLYCSFTSYSIERFSDQVEDYLNALEKEITYGATLFRDKKLTTVYFGGGTPTTLTAQQLDRLLGLVREKYDFTHVMEFCVEAGRPDSITEEKLRVLKKWGVDRISINPQSMQQRTLDLIGRHHSIEQVKEAFRLARNTGHNNINMDLIIGLPGEKPEDVADTLAQIKELNPESLTVHTLALKRAARLNIEKANYEGLRAEEVPEMLELTLKYAEENDYLPYYLYRQKNMADNLENIGYARYGMEGLYNILIMEEQQTILALGAGAMSKFVFHEENRIERVDNVKSVTDYISRIDEMIQRKQDFLLSEAIFTR
ncbi:MAG TPA: coproporphyrinogen dehydrogenase HemZ [Mobilitalea sp.]|nr:coproporphyrinogen dehydrogenase HemZ [Mobilitalea sp.]